MALVMPTDDLTARLDRMRQDLDQANVPGLLEDAAREIRRLQAKADIPRVNESATRAGAAEFQKTTDAEVWADEFCRIVGEAVPAIRGEREWIFRWFANAIGAGEKAGRRDAEKELDRLRAENNHLRATVSPMNLGMATDSTDLMEDR